MSRNSFTVIDIKTGKYPDLEAIALYEDWAKGLCYCDMEGFSIMEDGSLYLLDECGKYAYCPVGRFEIVWDEDDKTNVIFGRNNDGTFQTECSNCGTYLDKAYSKCPKCQKELNWNASQR